MTSQQTGAGPGRRRHVVLGGGTLVVLVAAYFVLAATIPAGGPNGWALRWTAIWARG
ncbi:hypothetical protein [Streptomyces sp. NBC_01244]|uniref:hypothetical protein n=1 Tax=Streptomyces sp. NBC_01244 TaxID=2903797 RepID=UPI002E13726B|nr:hypothetical protein OG247_07310 [Streptomyces sp. NBC_01244]